MRQLLLQQTVIYQSFGSSRHIHTSVQPCSHALFYIIPLINAGNRRLLQSFPDPSQTEGVASCRGTLCFVCLFFSKVIDLLVSPLNLFLVPVFVLRVFSDWCCDNYKEDRATGIPVDWNDSHRAIVLLLG